MTSNKSSRKTNEGYIYRDTKNEPNSRLKPVKDSEKLRHIESKPSTNHKAYSQSGHSHKYQATNQANKPTIKKPIAYSQQNTSEQEDSQYEYSFNHPQKQNPLSQPNQRKTNPLSSTHAKPHLSANSLEQQNLQLLRQVEIMSLSLKQAHYENQILREKLSESEEKSELLEKNLIDIQMEYRGLEGKYHGLRQNQEKALQQSGFMKQCEQEIRKLKILVKDLSEQKQRLQMSQAPSEREEIKDRIIMKLQDQLITVKLLLQEEKQKNIQKSTGHNQPLQEITQNFTGRQSASYSLAGNTAKRSRFAVYE